MPSESSPWSAPRCRQKTAITKPLRTDVPARHAASVPPPRTAPATRSLRGAPRALRRRRAPAARSSTAVDHAPPAPRAKSPCDETRTAQPAVPARSPTEHAPAEDSRQSFPAPPPLRHPAQRPPPPTRYGRARNARANEHLRIGKHSLRKRLGRQFAVDHRHRSDAERIRTENEGRALPSSSGICVGG